MENVYDTEIVEILPENETENGVSLSPDVLSDESAVEEVSSEIVVTVPTVEEGNTQSADIIVCLVVIILAIGIACGVALGRILWERIR